MSRLLEVTPWGMAETFDYDHASGVVTLTKTQDITGILDANVKAANDGGYKGEEGDWWHVASIPLIVLEEWFRTYERETGRKIGSPFSSDPDWERFCVARLDSSDWRKLRSMDCRIGDHGAR